MGRKKERKGRFEALSNFLKGTESNLQPKSGSPLQSLQPSTTPGAPTSQGVQESWGWSRERSQGQGSRGCGVGESLPAFCKKKKSLGLGQGPKEAGGQGPLRPGHRCSPGAGGGRGKEGAKSLPARLWGSSGQLRLPNYRNHTWFLSQVTS